MITKGEELFSVPLPRISILALSSPGRLLDDVTCKPAANPAKAFEMFVIGRLSVNVLISTEDTDPDKFTFFCVPKPTTTTSSNVWVSSFMEIVTEVLFPTLMN